MDRKVLIVDDDALNVEVLAELLGDDYTLDTALSGEECLQKGAAFQPDLILLDIMMPGIDGYETCRRIKRATWGQLVQVLLVSAKASTAERLQGYEAGADDYVIKPFDHDELLAKVAIQFRLRGVLTDLSIAHARIKSYSESLERLVTERTEEVIATRDVTVFALAKLAESRDTETGQHLERLRAYSQILARRLHERGPYTHLVNEQFLSDLYRSSPLHDIGKVGIPDVILLKPGRLSSSEFEIMKRHAILGAETLESIARKTRFGSFLEMAAQIARHHHERFNGSGYPDGLEGEAIPLPARIVALADVYDALTSVRVYKAAFAPEVARQMIEDERGKHFDPAIVDAFVDCWEQFLEAPLLLPPEEDEDARANQEAVLIQ